MQDTLFYIVAIVVVLLIIYIYYQYKYYPKTDEGIRKSFAEAYTHYNSPVKELPMKSFGDYFMRGYINKYRIMNEPKLNTPERQRQINNDYLLAYQLFAGNDGLLREMDIPAAFAAYNIDETLHTNLTKKGAEERIKAAATTTKLGTAENYYKESAKVANDRQNVHDSELTKQVREICHRLNEESHLNIEHDQLEDIVEKIQLSNNADAITSIKHLGSDIMGLNMKDTDVLRLVWNRSYHPANAENSKNIREAVIERLSDCVENGGVVCPSGRVARIVDALTLLDYEPTSIKTSDMFKNEIFSASNTIINAEVERCKTHPRFSDVAKSYTDPSHEYNDNDEEAFRDMVKDKIEKYIDENYSHVKNIEKIKRDALLAV